MTSWLFFLSCSLLAILVQGLFALFEMACISFNTMRLQYLASIGKKRAIWLNELIQRPSRLFGATLIGITTALLIGSECSRRFYESIHLNPDFAPLSQVILVVLFGELVPMVSARHHPEQFAMALAPLMILVARVLTPAIWMIELLSQGICRLIGKKAMPYFLSREEVQKAFEEDEYTKDEFNALVTKTFSMKNLFARQLMASLQSMQLLDSNATLADVRHQLSIRYTPFLLIYHRNPQNIVAIVYVRDLLGLALDKKKVLDVAKPPWFVTQDATLLQILEQFRRNNQSISVILDAGGQASGVLSLDQIIDAMFGSKEAGSVEEPIKGGLTIERTISGSMSVEQFNRDFQADFPSEIGNTISDLLVKEMEHLPTKGESMNIGLYKFTVLEPSLRGAKLILVVRR